MAKNKSTPKTFIDPALMKTPNLESQMQINFREFNDSTQNIEGESMQQVKPSIEDKKNKEPQISANEKIEQDNMSQAKVTSNEDEKSLWNDFIHLAEESQKMKKKEAQVWVDADLKNILERIRC